MPDTWSPDLEAGETIVYHHVPSVPAFWRAMLRPVGLFFLVLTVPFILYLWFYQDMSWLMFGLAQLMVWVPVVFGILMERASLRDCEAYLTDRRAIGRGYGEFPLEEAGEVETFYRGLRLKPANEADKPLEFGYPEDPDALADTVRSTLKTAA